jgi:hypothetical protein
MALVQRTRLALGRALVILGSLAYMLLLPLLLTRILDPLNLGYAVRHQLVYHPEFFGEGHLLLSFCPALLVSKETFQ